MVYDIAIPTWLFLLEPIHWAPNNLQQFFIITKLNWSHAPRLGTAGNNLHWDQNGALGGLYPTCQFCFTASRISSLSAINSGLRCANGFEMGFPKWDRLKRTLNDTRFSKAMVLRGSSILRNPLIQLQLWASSYGQVWPSGSFWTNMTMEQPRFSVTRRHLILHAYIILRPKALCILVSKGCVSHISVSSYYIYYHILSSY